MVTLDPFDPGTALTLIFTELLGTTMNGIHMGILAQKDPHSSLHLPDPLRALPYRLLFP